MDWHPDAKRVVSPSAGAYTPGTGHKIVWHTTETKGLPSYDGTQPHFTLNPRTGELWQHQPISEAAKALVHTVPPETNRAHAYQVELICYSSESVAKQVGGLAVPALTDADYKEIAKLARWIEKNADVPRKSSVTFAHYPESINTPRLSSTAWLAYKGHCGHQHVPNNPHGDPSTLDIKKILAAPPPWKLVKDGKVFARGSFTEMRHWLREHSGKVKRLKGINLRPNR